MHALPGAASRPGGLGPLALGDVPIRACGSNWNIPKNNALIGRAKSVPARTPPSAAPRFWIGGNTAPRFSAPTRCGVSRVSRAIQCRYRATGGGATSLCRGKDLGAKSHLHGTRRASLQRQFTHAAYCECHDPRSAAQWLTTTMVNSASDLPAKCFEF